jgi:hypothetical protein
MTRTALTLLALVALSVWASAQNATAPQTADHVRLLALNNTLLDSLLDRALDVSNAGNALERAERCRKATATLGSELRTVAADPAADPDRVAELSDHLTAVVRDGLAPTLAEARGQHHPGSPGYERLKKVYADAKAELELTRNAIPTDGKVGRSQLVKGATQKLTAAAAGIQFKEEN